MTNVQRIGIWIICLGAVITSAISGIGGINFGKHGDEPRLYNAVAESARTLLFLPRWYNYPSVSYDVVMIGALPEWKNIIAQALHAGTLTTTNTTEANPYISIFNSDAFIHRTRVIFFFVTWLSLIWIFLGTLTLTKKPWLATFTLLLAAGSWELNYHARWVAPDGLVVSFGSLTLAATLWFYASHRRAALWIAAIAAGLTCSAKYPGGIFLLPVLLSCFDDLTWSALRSGLRSTIIRSKLLTVLGLFFGTFFITTPGALVDPLKFVSSVLFEVRHYQHGHGSYTVSPIFEHGALMFDYLARVLFSSNPWIAIMLFAVSIIGIIQIIKTLPRKLSIILCLTPSLYIAYMSTQRAMIVRNYLLLLPFLCIFSAYGIDYLWQKARQRWLKIAIIGLIALATIYNFTWEVKTMISIRHPEQTKAEALQAITRLEQPIIFSPAAKDFLAINNDHQATTGTAKTYVFLEQDITTGYPTNRVGAYHLIGGPIIANTDFYPGFFLDHTKVLEMDADSARKLNLLK